MEEGETPKFEKIIVYHNNKRLEIEADTMDSILYYIDNIKFELKDYSKFHIEKEILEYYYDKEKESIGYMALNFQDKKDYQEFFINFTKEIINDKYISNVQINNIKQGIESGIEKIAEEFKKNEKLELDDLPQKYSEIFKTTKIPFFINNKLIEEIQSIKLVKKLNNDYRIKKDSKGEEFLKYYVKILNGEQKPFEIGNKNNLFNIFLYSNLKDIYKNPKVKEVIAGNYYEVSKCFLNYWENFNEFESEINNKKRIDYIDDKLIGTFGKYEINDSYLYTLASFFYLIMNEIKDTDTKNQTSISFNNKYININNPIMNKILKNILYCFYAYCPSKNYNYETYINLYNFFNNYIIVNGIGVKVNKNYDFSNIAEKIRKTNSIIINEDFNILKEKIYLVDNIKIASKILLNKNNIFNNEEFKNSAIHLIPLTKNIRSNTITILISGFLSQKDDINSWQHFFNYDRNNSNYYLFRWPSSDISTLIFKSLIFILNVAKMFLDCKKKAKYAGKILALFLASNEEFNNCQINIVGFSLGCQVTKYCIKELDKIKGHRIMINNVLFLAGATVMDEEKKVYGEIDLEIMLWVGLLIAILHMIGFLKIYLNYALKKILLV